MVLTWLAVVGLTEPSSFITMRMAACPRSPKIVGHGLSGAHGAGDVTLVITSDVSVADAVPSVAAPRMPASESMTMYEDARPLRTTLPHDTDAATSAATAANRLIECIRFIL